MLNAYCLRPEILPNRHPPDDGLVEAEIAAWHGFWQCQTLKAGLWCTHAGDIGAPSAENADLVVIQTQPLPWFLIERKTIEVRYRRRARDSLILSGSVTKSTASSGFDHDNAEGWLGEWIDTKTVMKRQSGTARK
jgi:hypothetical protein